MGLAAWFGPQGLLSPQVKPWMWSLPGISMNSVLTTHLPLAVLSLARKRVLAPTTFALGCDWWLVECSSVSMFVIGTNTIGTETHQRGKVEAEKKKKKTERSSCKSVVCRGGISIN
jgi:hypothetical protein